MLGKNILNQLKFSVEDVVWKQEWEQLWNIVGNQVGRHMNSGVGDRVSGQVREIVWVQIRYRIN